MKMLVLSRRPQESIVIGGNIRVTIIKTGAGAVRLGIEAPAEIAVHREEIQRKIDEPNVADRITFKTLESTFWGQ